MTTTTASPPSASPTTFEELGQLLGVRKLMVIQDEIRQESHVALSKPLIQAAAVAVVRNPWLGTGPDQDLGPATQQIAPVVGKLLADRLIHTLGGVDNIEAFGKAALVGTDGELEHAGALIHTPYFGNIIRELLGGTSVLCFADGRASVSADVRIPLWHKTHATSRPHYQTLEIHLPDAPHPDEICIIAAASTGPRPFPRIGDRSTDGEVTTDILKGLL